MNTEMQWASVEHRTHSVTAVVSESERLELFEKVDVSLRARFPGVPVLVLPSGRAAIALMLKYLRAGRGDAIAAPRWSSSCVWSILGRFGCPTLGLQGQPFAALVVHKYGYVETCVAKGIHILEDSCDSLLDPKALFPNGGLAEIVSLPKILGTYAGGLLFLRDAQVAEELRCLTQTFTSFDAEQGRLRWLDSDPEYVGAPTWDHLEFQHFCPDGATLASILAGLSEWDDRARIVQSRLELLMAQRPDLWELGPFRPAPGRLPCVFPLPSERLSQAPKELILRHMNVSGRMDTEDFRPMVLLPLHREFPEDQFLGWLNGMKRI